MQKICSLILKILGWKTSDGVPAINKMVICVAPHTSNWDFVIGKLFYSSMGLKVSFLIKDDWLRPPFGKWMKKRGAIGVNRKGKHSMTEQLTKLFKSQSHLHLAITPEGTRKANPNWKLGFYYIAKKANVPILLIGLDYKYKEAKVLGLFTPTENEDEDIKEIKRYFKNIHAKYPNAFDLGNID